MAMLEVPMHGFIVVREGAKGEVRSNCATSMLHGALCFFIQSLQCSFLTGLVQSLGIATLQVLVRVSVPGFVGKDNHADRAPGLRAPVLELIHKMGPAERRPPTGFCTLSTKVMGASTTVFVLTTWEWRLLIVAKDNKMLRVNTEVTSQSNEECLF